MTDDDLTSMAGGASRLTKREPKRPPARTTAKRVKVQADMTEEEREALRVLGFPHGLTLSTTIVAFAQAAAAGDMRLHALLSEFGPRAHRPRGGGKNRDTRDTRD